MKYVTSESVLEGHPDKVCDYIADSILDAHLTKDPDARVACEVMAKGHHIVLAGEITGKNHIHHKAIVKQALADVGYGNFRVAIADLIQHQIPALSDNAARGFAGDQGVMVGYACNETQTLMPLPSYLAHKIAKAISDYRKQQGIIKATPLLLPDGKVQVTIEYDDLGRPVRALKILASVQHVATATVRQVRMVIHQIILDECGFWVREDTDILINPQHSPFTVGGPEGDSGLTGRKIVIDAYGGSCLVGGGSFSGKDATKVDRSGAYAARWVAREIIREQIASRAEVSVAYSIGRAEPLAINVECDTHDFGAQELAERFDWRPKAIIERFDLCKPRYRQTTNYGHFGKLYLPWEQ